VPSPVGWSGYLVQITNFTDSATAETGISTAAPSVSASGTIKYWNGAGYTSLTIVKGASVPLVVGPVAVTYTPNGNGTPVVISITASLSTGGTATVDSSPSCLVPCTRTAASATSNSPLVGTITYKVTQGVVTVANLSIHVDFGALTANANYTPSPSAG